MDLTYIADCGVDCSACPDRLADKCPGCRQTVWKEGDECMPAACCGKKGVSACGRCPDFPCEAMKGFYEESEGHRQAYARMQALRGEA